MIEKQAVYRFRKMPKAGEVFLYLGRRFEVTDVSDDGIITVQAPCEKCREPVVIKGTKGRFWPTRTCKNCRGDVPRRSPPLGMPKAKFGQNDVVYHHKHGFGEIARLDAPRLRPGCVLVDFDIGKAQWVERSQLTIIKKEHQ